MTKLSTNKGELFIAGNLVDGASVFNDADMDGEAEDAVEINATNAAGESITLSITGGKIANVVNKKVADPDMDDDDIDADNKIVLNQAGINFKKVDNKVDHKAIKNAAIKKLGEVTNLVNHQNTLIVDLKKQLAASNELVQRSEIEVKNQIISEFTPTNSKRSTKPGEQEGEPLFKPKENSYAANAAQMAVNKLKK